MNSPRALSNRKSRSMDMKEVMEHVRVDLRERPDSHFSEVYLRILKRGASSTDVHTALYEMLKRDEVRIKEGKWRMAASADRRRAS
jgi:hypothetical protein